MGFAKIKGKLVTRIGQPVRFKVPNDVRNKGGDFIHGEVIDEIWATPKINNSSCHPERFKHDWGDYSFFAQLIRWDEGGYNIRLGYYRRRCDEDWWEFSGQTTISGEPEEIIQLLEKVIAKKKSWIRKK